MIFVTTLQGSCFGICEKTGYVVLKCTSEEPIFGSPCIYKDTVIKADVKGNVTILDIKNFDTVSVKYRPVWSGGFSACVLI